MNRKTMTAVGLGVFAVVCFALAHFLGGGSAGPDAGVLAAATVGGALAGRKIRDEK